MVFVEEIKEVEMEYKELGRKTRQEIAELKRYLNDLNHEIGKKFKELEELRAWEKVGDDKSKEIEATTKKIQYLQDKIVETDDMIKDKEQNILDNLEVNMNRARTETARRLYPEARKYKNDLENRKQETHSKIYKLKREITELNQDINGLNAYLEGRKQGITSYENQRGQPLDEILNEFTKYKNMKEYQQIGRLKSQIRELETDRHMIQGLEAKTLEELKEIEDEHRIYQNKSRALKKKEGELQKIQSKILEIDNKIQSCENQIKSYQKITNEAIFMKISDEILPRLQRARDKKKLELKKAEEEFKTLRKPLREVRRELDFLGRVAGREWVHDYHMKELAKT